MIVPLYGVLVKPVRESETRVTASGLALPDTGQSRTQLGVVTEVSFYQIIANKLEETKLSIGNVVIFPNNVGVEYNQDGIRYIFLREIDILGVRK